MVLWMLYFIILVFCARRIINWVDFKVLFWFIYLGHGAGVNWVCFRPKLLNWRLEFKHIFSFSFNNFAIRYLNPCSVSLKFCAVIKLLFPRFKSLFCQALIRNKPNRRSLLDLRPEHLLKRQLFALQYLLVNRFSWQNLLYTLLHFSNFDKSQIFAVVFWFKINIVCCLVCRL